MVDKMVPLRQNGCLILDKVVEIYYSLAQAPIIMLKYHVGFAVIITTWAQVGRNDIQWSHISSKNNV